jgi:TFIIF-interacting CTD phosphatase-like protein
VEGQFVLQKPTKEFFLVLDLDETLIHFQISNTDENKGILSLRPGIYEFLNSVSKYYELMIFTAGTDDVRHI